jgi:hypothetical protein
MKEKNQQENEKKYEDRPFEERALRGRWEEDETRDISDEPGGPVFIDD